MEGSHEHPHRRASAWALFLLLLITALVPQVTGADDTEEVHTVRFSDQGRYAIVAGGVGMLEPISGDIQLDVPGTAIRAAYLYWAGYGSVSGGDGTVSLAKDGVPLGSVSADPIGGTSGPLLWWGGYYYFAYVADVTAWVDLGSHTYTISDFGDGLASRDGAGLMVVYEDPALPYNQAEILAGLDRFYRGWGDGPRAETAVNCFDFEAGLADRQLEITLFVGEIYPGGPSRPNALWYKTGTGAVPRPADMVNSPTDGPVTGDLLQGPPSSPFTSVDGPQWDTYTKAVRIPSGHTWACFQVESARYEAEKPASGVWLVTAGSLPIDESPGTIIIKKVSHPAGGAGFRFDGDLGRFGLDDGQIQDFLDVAPGAYTVIEADPGPAYALADVACSDPDGQSSVDLDARSVTIDLDPGEMITCSFTNVAPPDIRVTKTADPTFVKEPGDSVEFVIEVTNASLTNLTIRSLVDTVFSLDAHCSDAVGTVLEPDETYSCTFSEAIEGSAPAFHRNEVTAAAADGWGITDTESAEAMVTITDEKPSLCLPLGLIFLVLLLIVLAVLGLLRARKRAEQP
ncbi:hypothetical protein ACFLYD_09140 [Chloroflexota bacterium]